MFALSAVWVLIDCPEEVIMITKIMIIILIIVIILLIIVVIVIISIIVFIEKKVWIFSLSIS